MKPELPVCRPAGNPTLRRQLLLVIWLGCGAFLLWKAAEVQLVHGAEWRVEANRQHQARGAVPAARGDILDRDGAPLALSHEAFRVGVAPHELSDRDEVRQILMDALALPESEARRITSSERRWVQLSDRYPPSAREALSSVTGVYVERELRRFHPHGGLASSILGNLLDDVGAGGIEQEYEEILRGTAGTRVVARDSEGRPIPGESWIIDAPRSGGTVITTLDRDLQEIARESLREAIGETGARGGDLVVADPRSGEILAMVSLNADGSTTLSSINAPYEPGSTLKPFTVARMMELGLVNLSDSVDTGDGVLQTHGRTIRDVSRVGTVTLAHALQASSNVGIVRMSEVLSPNELYEGLRDFGFGAPTGIRIPGEAGGHLRPPSQWSRLSPASLAMGYEVSVTPLQMTMAYAALANGGLLLEPRIIREVRDSRGRPLEVFEPRAVRRVVSRTTAEELTAVLVGAVDEGTGTRAQLASFSVAGKSGTSRASGPDGRYEVGAYYASFVGYFPAEAPQLVVFVKLDRPRGEYYGGATAAPVTRATMEAVLAARHPPLDRRALAAIARSQALHEVGPDERTGNGLPRPTAAHLIRAVSDDAGEGVRLPTSGGPAASAETRMAGLPDLVGQPARTAVRRLHGLGVVVQWEGRGHVISIDPPAGTALNPGDTVWVRAAPPGGGP